MLHGTSTQKTTVARKPELTIHLNTDGLLKMRKVGLWLLSSGEITSAECSQAFYWPPYGG